MNFVAKLNCLIDLLEMLARDQRLSLLLILVNDGQKSFIILGPESKLTAIRQWRRKLRRKPFYEIGHRRVKISWSSCHRQVFSGESNILSKARAYPGPTFENIFVGNLRIFVISWSVCPWQDFPA
jgi:hypothetical protein